MIYYYTENLWAFAGVNKSLTVTPSASSLDNALRIHKELYKKDLHDPDNQNGVITHREPDIMECEVKWALGSITTNKASGGDGRSTSWNQDCRDKYQ